MADITGTEGPDNLDGTTEADAIDGLGGDDIIDGGEGADDIDGGDGNDIIYSYSAGEDRGEQSGESRIREQIFGGSGNDTIYLIDYPCFANVDGGLGIDRLDVDLRGGATGDVEYANGSGEISFGIVTARVQFTGIEEIIVRNEGLWFVRLGDTNDTIVADGYRNDIETGGGNDVIQSSGELDLISGGAGSDVITSFAGGFSDVSGGPGDDVLFGGNVVTGDEGDDRLGGLFDADLYGGTGNDIYDYDGTQHIFENPNEGVDLVRSSVSFILGRNLENLTLTGTSAIDATGNAGDNLLIGNDAANVLNGRAGNDTMGGRGGNDTYFVDSAGDVIFEPTGGGIDLVQSTVSYALLANVENLALKGTAAINATGNSLSNILTGNEAANMLDGRGGADRMVGRGGNDTYFVDNAADVIVENAGQGIDTVRSSITYTLSATEIEKLVLTGGAGIGGTGNGYANAMVGNSAANNLDGAGGNDRLEGRGGNDQLYGGLGSDVLYGEAGNDGFRFNSALHATTNVDTLADFSAADDTVFLDRGIFSAAGPNGMLAAGAFHVGNAAQDADDRIVYDPASGLIYYDSDGVGGADAILFARVDAGTALTNADFFVYG